MKITRISVFWQRPKRKSTKDSIVDPHRENSKEIWWLVQDLNLGHLTPKARTVVIKQVLFREPPRNDIKHD